MWVKRLLIREGNLIVHISVEVCLVNNKIENIVWKLSAQGYVDKLPFDLSLHYCGVTVAKGV